MISIITFQNKLQVSFIIKIDYKQNNILNIEINQRMVGLGFSTIIFSILMRKLNKNIFFAGRKIIMTYFLAGTFIVPELFNPFILK